MATIIDKDNNVIRTVGSADLSRFKSLSGYLKKFNDTDVVLPLSTRDAEAVMRYLYNPVVENYYAIPSDQRTMLELKVSSRDLWLRTGYIDAVKFKKTTGKVFIWDTTPDFDEVLQNLIQTAIMFKLTIHLVDSEPHAENIKRRLLSINPNIKVRSAESYSSDSLVFNYDPLVNNTNGKSVCEHHSYFFMTLYNQDVISKGGSNFYIGNVALTSTPSLHPLSLYSDAPGINPVYRVALQDKSLSNYVSHIPQINSLGIYPPKFVIKQLPEDEVDDTIEKYKMDAVVVYDPNISTLEEGIRVEMDLYPILAGIGVEDDYGNALLVSPYPLNEKVPDDLPVIVIAEEVTRSTLIESGYMSLNPVTFYYVFGEE